MASVYLARAAGEAGFQRLFAIKILHPYLALEPGFVTMLLDEARLAARIHHPNVVPILDLGTEGTSHYVVLEYVEGCSLSALVKRRRDERPPRIVVPLMLDAIAGLDAAHSLVDDNDASMHLVHRDVSPQNILVGIDGSARITDFGVARAESRINTTRPGQIKGKYAYMSPEQIRAPTTVDHRSDIFSMGAVLWSLLTARKLFQADNDPATMHNIMELEVPAPSTIGLQPPTPFDAVCLRALERDPAARFQSMQEMEDALRAAAAAADGLAQRREIGAWVTESFSEELQHRRSAIRAALASNRGTAELPSFTPSLTDPPGTPPSASTEGAKSLPPAPVNRSARRIAFVAVPIIACVVGWYSFRAVTRHAPPATPTPTPSTPAMPDIAPSTPAMPDIAPSTPPQPNAAAEPAAAIATPPPVTTSPSSGSGDDQPPDARASGSAHSAITRHKPAPVIRRPVTTATPKPPEPPKPAAPWDKDSPLPPP
jgi:serine/threonine protein kinase